MYELDFFAVGDGERSGDAFALRYTVPGISEPIVGIIDAGFLASGEALIAHVKDVYGTSQVDFVLSTHPDGDHINGMGEVVRELDVRCLLIHRPGQHGNSSNSGSKPAEELVKLAKAKGASVVEPFAGVSGYGDSFVIAGPTKDFYEAKLAEQTATSKEAAGPRLSLAQRFVGTSVVKAVRRVLSSFPIEREFDDAGGDNPRNNSSAILSLMIDGRHLLFFGDAGVPAITEAMGFLDGQERTKEWPKLIVLPHHGSRHNLDLSTIHRVLGAHTDSMCGHAVASVSEESDNPSPRVANAVGRRGYKVYPTAGSGFRIAWEAPARPGWNGTATPLGPLEETDHDA